MNDPARPEPARKGNNRLLVGCLVVFAICILGFLGLAALGTLMEHFESPAQRAAEKERDAKAAAKEKAADAAEQESRLTAGKRAQAHLAAVAAAITPDADLKAVACPHIHGDSLGFASVDAAYMRRFNGKFPRDTTGSPWMRHATTFGELADAVTSMFDSADYENDTAISVDKTLAGIGYVGVIHTTTLTPPKLISSGGSFTHGSFMPGEFSGWIQIIDYPDARPVCEIPFTATNSDKVGGGISVDGVPLHHGANTQLDDDFEDNVLKAAQAAVDNPSTSE